MKMYKAAAAMIAIIMVRMALSWVFTEQVGTVFCNTALTALFFHAVTSRRAEKTRTNQALNEAE